mgnify:CR=1 FL=1
MDKLELFNELIKVIIPVNAKNAHATSLDQQLVDTGMDSLDLLMMGIYLADIYGVDEATAKHAQPKTVQEFFDFMEKYKSKEPTDVTSAVGSIK